MRPLTSLLIRSSKLAASAAFLVAVVAARPASAAPILITANSNFTVSWLNTTTNPGVWGSAEFAITNFGVTGFDLTVSNVRNLTPLPDIDARLTSFGFGLTPDAASFTNLDDGTVFSWGFSNFPGFQQVDACLASGNNCAGGGNGGLKQGESTLATDTMGLHVIGDFANGITFSPFAAKFQAAGRSYELAGCVGDCTTFTTTDVTPVPEPGSLVLLGSGLAAAARGLRRRRMR